MKAQRQRVQMPEHVQRDAADRALRHAHEHHVAQLGEERRGKAQRAVGDEQRERQRHDLLRRRQRVDDLLEHERHRDVRELRGDEESERNDDAPLVFQKVRDEQRYDTPLASSLEVASVAGGRCGRQRTPARARASHDRGDSSDTAQTGLMTSSGVQKAVLNKSARAIPPKEG